MIIGALYLAMSKHELSQQNSNLFVPLSIMFLLFVGIIVSVIQAQHQQNQDSRAAMLPPTISPSDCSVNPVSLAITLNEKAIFDQLNNYRRKNGVGLVTLDDALNKAAVWSSNDNLVHNRLAHTDSLGRTPTKRIADCGLLDSIKVGENIENGTRDPNVVMSTWEHSPPQSTILLDPLFTKVGISESTDSSNSSGSYWTVALGTDPVPTPTPRPITPSPTSPPLPSVNPSTRLTATPTGLVFPTLSVTRFPTSFGPTQKVLTPVPTKRFTPTGVIIPSPTVDPRFSLNLNDTQIRVAIKLPGIGIGGNQLPKHLSRKVKVSIFDNTNKAILTGTGFVTYDSNDLFTGIVHLGKLDNGVYYIKVVSDHTLQALVLPQFESLLSNRLNVLSPVTLLQGELTNDNAITIADYNMALACLQNKKCAVQVFPGENAVDQKPQVYDFLDLNDDGKVNVQDYNILLHNFWQQLGDD